MDEPNKLPLLKNSLQLLVDSCGPTTRVAIVTYAGNAGTVLEPTKVEDKAKILAALDNLEAGGSTAGAEGIRQAYQLAEPDFDKTGVNRVILATDGDFNVGITDPDELEELRRARSATAASISRCSASARGNYNDALMQKLAQTGNGNAAYIDTLNEARKVLVDEAASTLFTIAKDVKIQVEFNPATVSEYRLIGYENAPAQPRGLQQRQGRRRRDRRGPHGDGALRDHAEGLRAAQLVDPLRYQQNAGAGGARRNERRERLPAHPLQAAGRGHEQADRDADLDVERSRRRRAVAMSRARPASPLRWRRSGRCCAVGRYTTTFGYDDVIALANAAKGQDDFGYRSEFVNLVQASEVRRRYAAQQQQ